MLVALLFSTRAVDSCLALLSLARAAHIHAACAEKDSASAGRSSIRDETVAALEAREPPVPALGGGLQARQRGSI
ncbi:MAG: hypothetical protein WBA87_13000, partial [Microbacterium sp.]